MDNLSPSLRFPEFSGSWESVTLGELTKINQGLQIPISDRYTEQKDGTYFYITNEFLRPGNKKKFYIKDPSSSVICQEDDVLMTRTGNTGQVVTGVSGAFHNNFFKINFDKEKLSRWFLIHFLRHHKTQHTILKFAGTSTIPDLNHSDFYRIGIQIPSFDEQQKIANFLTVVDKKISLLKEKHALLEQYKKGVMQKLFKQEIRFKDDSGSEFPDWQWKQGNEVFDAISNKSHNSDLPILAITQEHGAIPRGLINYQVQVTDGSVASYKVVEEGDYIISLRSFQGGIEYSRYKGICSPAYIILRPSISIDDDFYRYYLKTGRFIQEMKRRLEGIRDGKILSYKYFSEIKLPYPCIEEQRKISCFINTLDKKLNLVKEQIERTQSFKKGLLQQMFV